MSLDYYFLEADQDKPDIEVSQPLRHSYLIRNAFNLTEIRNYTRELHTLPWKIQEIAVAGKCYMPKRETLGFAAKSAENLLEDRNFYGLTYPNIIEQIREQVSNIIADQLNEVVKPEMNFCWGNRYRTGTDKVGKHKDNEKWHSPVDPIISVSLGVKRAFDVLGDHGRIERFHLGHGDIFLMMPGFQQAFYHAVPVQKKVVGSRINLTFRTLERPPKLR